MKEFFKRRASMRLVFILLVMGELTLVSVVSWVATQLLNRWFSITLQMPSVLWLAGISILIGFALANFMSRQFFAPITQLGRAMSQVAQGDFTVRLNEQHLYKEVRDIYANFNLMTQELGATEILQTDFVSNVSHEFKTPINAIEGYATLLQSEDPEGDSARYVEKILRNTRRLSNLVGNILLLSKVDNQAIQSRRATFRLDEQIRQSILMLEPEWSAKDIEFDIDMDEVEFTGNETLLPHIWSNLIGNAIKFNPRGGAIRMSLKYGAGEVVFTIEDSGPGIDETVKKHMFDKFYQGDSSHREEGNGLGLALVKQILAVTRGSIRADNLPQGGCRFVVTLPQP